MVPIKLLVCGATKTVKKYADPSSLGILFNPRNMNSIDIIQETGLKWAADNDCFNGFNPEIYIKMLEKIKNVPGCLFVTAPDVVADAEKTLELFEEWEPILREYGLPVALVAQDGQESIPVPWDRIDALFIGGTTEFKLGMTAFRLIQEAKKRGKWVHMGRVNSIRRLQYANTIGCDSIDGSGYSRFPETKIPGALKAMEVKQIMLEGLTC